MKKGGSQPLCCLYEKGVIVNKIFVIRKKYGDFIAKLQKFSDKIVKTIFIEKGSIS